MVFDVVRGHIRNTVATKDLISILEKYCSEKDISGTLYIGYPLSANIEDKITVDALFVSMRHGLIAFAITSDTDIVSIIDEQGELFYQLTNTLTQYPSLRKGKKIAFEPNVITLVPNGTRDIKQDADAIIVSFDMLCESLENLPPFDVQYYNRLVEALQKVASIKPRKKRENVLTNGSKGDVIKKIEKEIANMDQWQRKAAFEIVDGPQRIRGLAGTGKTIVLALKTAYLHSQNPSWNIVVTYYTRSLWQQYRDLITKFVFEFTRNEPDWEKINLLHSWGSTSDRGVYSEIASHLNIVPMNYSNARIKYGRQDAFAGICTDLLNRIPESVPFQYDAVLIDEAQDLPAPFFKILYKFTRSPKRIVWAYDELQNLSSVSMPSIEEMFGVDADDKLLVELKNEKDQPTQDIILPVCYRNPPWALGLAHSLGFGVYRSKLVQHFEGLDLWNDIGYTVERGSLNYGKDVTLIRSQDATPQYFNDLLEPREVIKTKVFDNYDDQYQWVAKQIRFNIDKEELDPDDILVIFPDAMSASRQYNNLANHLNQYGISSILAGVTNDRDLFKIDGSVSCSSIFRAKGNEAPLVYLVNSEFCYSGVELIRLRNVLFTAITRSRAWVRICGIGEEMNLLIDEIQKYIDSGYKLSFKIPTKPEMRKLKTINRERTESEAKKIEQAQKGIRTFLELAEKGEIDISQVPEFSTLMNLLLEKNMDEQDGEDE